MVGDAHAREVESRMQQAGLPSGLLKATGSDPWATMRSLNAGIPADWKSYRP